MTRRLRHARRLDRRSVRSMTDDQIIGLCGHHPDTRVTYLGTYALRLRRLLRNYASERR